MRGQPLKLHICSICALTFTCLLSIYSSDGEEVSAEEDDGEEDGANVEPADGETEESMSTASHSGKANGNKSSREVIRELDEKISKYKQFLERAKSKRFSAIRSV